jgi:hypothetical protein
MRRGLGLTTASAIIALTLMAVPPLASGASRGAIASAKCSRAAAQAALRAHPRFDPVYVPKLEFPSQVLCGTFLGAGARTMIVGFAANVCITDDYNLGWGAYRLSAGKWQPVWKHWEGSQSIAIVGSTVKETRGIRRPNDSGCNDTGGAESRAWHWNGRRFVASAWTTHLAPAPLQSNPPEFRVRLAGGGFECSLGVSGMLCVGAPNAPEGAEPLAQVAKLSSAGEVTRCTESLAKPVESCFVGNFGYPIPYLSFGQQTAVGPFTCKVLETGVECTVTATGKGFLITPQSVTEVGG